MWRKIISKLRGAANAAKEFDEAIHNEKYISEKFDELDADTMLRLDREELRRRCKGFSKQDWEIIISEAPVEMIHNRIGLELAEAKRFRKSVKEAFGSVGASLDFGD